VTSHEGVDARGARFSDAARIGPAHHRAVRESSAHIQLPRAVRRPMRAAQLRWSEQQAVPAGAAAMPRRLQIALLNFLGVSNVVGCGTAGANCRPGEHLNHVRTRLDFSLRASRAHHLRARHHSGFKLGFHRRWLTPRRSHVDCSLGNSSDTALGLRGLFCVALALRRGHRLLTIRSKGDREP
jgi:hypothetical protein